jgi:hypothetical protein
MIPGILLKGFGISDLGERDVDDGRLTGVEKIALDEFNPLVDVGVDSKIFNQCIK